MNRHDHHESIAHNRRANFAVVRVHDRTAMHGTAQPPTQRTACSARTLKNNFGHPRECIPCPWNSSARSNTSKIMRDETVTAHVGGMTSSGKRQQMIASKLSQPHPATTRATNPRSSSLIDQGLQLRCTRSSHSSIGETREDQKTREQSQ